LDDAIRRYGEAAEISRRLDDPTGEAMARILFGVVQLRATHLDEARQALEEAHRLAPADSALAARALNFLGQVAARRADQEAARRLLGEALELYDRLGVRDRDVGIATMELGILDWRRGDLAVAEKRYLRAREIFQSDPSQRVYLAWVVQNLALVAHSRGDLATAEDLLQRALTLRQRPDRKTYGEAVARFNLASLQIERENFEGARRQLEQAIEVIAERRPGSDAEAEVLTGLARVATEQDRFAAAEEYLARAETTVRQRLPQGFDHALVHYTAGRLELARGNPAAAEERFRREITIRRRIQPATGDLARALHALARVRQQRGDPAQARRLLIEAVEALEAQRQRLGGPHEALALFTDRYAKIYKDLIALLLDGGETAAAFRISERYRAQGLLALLASRELTFGKALPEPLRRQRQENARAYDAAQAALANLASSSDPALLAQHLDGLRELQRQRAEIDRAVWQQDDRLRHLEAGRAIAPDALVGLLPAGTLLVSFVVRDDELISFTLGADAELAAERSPIPRHQLGQRVERFQLLNHHRDSDEAARRQLAQDLWSELFSVWQERLADADRLLVIADGPLHRLPFAALLTADGHYAIESWGLQQVVSATVLAELAARPARPANRVVAFADPTSTTIDGRPRPPLPAARREARGLARRFPGTTVLTGRHASEPAAKALPTTANWLHFACHARIDHRFPLDSYLALAPGRNGDNGLLQAWEVFEEMRLESDLVVLSACDSGGGRAVDGDGTIGLTRAFHFAGARSVLATQWPVADGSTADLMDHFYSALEAGASPVEALRRAQRDFLTGQTQPSRQHPFYWAGFQLFGPG
ncbi:MAG: CHAT domain-containing protein, partial [Acidobacteriota bacterium]